MPWHERTRRCWSWKLGWVLVAIGLMVWPGGCRRPVVLAADTLVMAVEKPPKTLDPRVGNDAVSARLHQIIFDTLVNKNEQLDIVPELADFTISPDGRVFTFRLRPGVFFTTAGR